MGFDRIHESGAKLIAALTVQSRNRQYLPIPAQPVTEFADQRFSVRRLQQVNFVNHQPSLFLGQRRTEVLKLFDYGRCITYRFTAIYRKRINQMQQKSRAGQMLQEAKAQTAPSRRPRSSRGYPP